MFKAGAFWSRRFSEHMKETSRYLRYIFNGHLAAASIFFVSVAAYYYQQWLSELPENYPTAVIVGIAFGLIASYSPVRTLLKEPDLVFLMPAEHRLGEYFKRCLLYSYVVQLYLILVIGAALGPLYSTSYPGHDTSYYLMMLGVLLVVKVWNLLANWWMLKERNSRIRAVDSLLRTVLSVFIFYFLAKGDWVFAAIITVLLFGLMMYNYVLAKKKAGLAWDVLLQKDQSRMRTFYRIANNFTDVPHLKNTVKKRHWLVKLLTSAISYKQDRSYDYLYRITFVRSSDYLGMYLRLIVIGGLAVYFVTNLWVKVAFALLFLYLSAFQMMTLWNHHRTIAWLDLYPLKKAWQQRAITQWLLRLMLFQTFLFGLLFIIQWSPVGLIAVWVGGTLFSYLFINGYVKKKLV
ncbi:ABC transporter permease [Thalassobacillus hwangdonensis]|uniref:ABC transporter permease n=1 Tax=Thalassobacillus hwangdonensis TaxID=546108 RepID=A0ABW3KVS8_9BACI